MPLGSPPGGDAGDKWGCKPGVWAGLCTCEATVWAFVSPSLITHPFKILPEVMTVLIWASSPALLPPVAPGSLAAPFHALCAEQTSAPQHPGGTSRCGFCHPEQQCCSSPPFPSSKPRGSSSVLLLGDHPSLDENEGSVTQLLPFPCCWMHLGTPGAAVRWVSSGAPPSPFRAPSVCPCLLHPHPLPFGFAQPGTRAESHVSDALEVAPLPLLGTAHHISTGVPHCPDASSCAWLCARHHCWRPSGCSIQPPTRIPLGLQRAGGGWMGEVPGMAVPLFPNSNAVVKLEESCSFGFVFEQNEGILPTLCATEALPLGGLLISL